MVNIRKITVTTCFSFAGNTELCNVGDVLEIEDAQAEALVQSGYAKYSDSTAEPVKVKKSKKVKKSQDEDDSVQETVASDMDTGNNIDTDSDTEVEINLYIDSMGISQELREDEAVISLLETYRSTFRSLLNKDFKNENKKAEAFSNLFENTKKKIENVEADNK